MTKTYVPSAVDVVTHASRYLTRWQSKLVVGATAGQVLALTNLITCLLAFLQEWHKAAPIN
jgi:hypothetical protein